MKGKKESGIEDDMFFLKRSMDLIKELSEIEERCLSGKEGLIFVDDDGDLQFNNVPMISEGYITDAINEFVRELVRTAQFRIVLNMQLVTSQVVSKINNFMENM